ncbi:putative bifunctional diguanylate cyclase/phosphodiesterase [Mycobacterium sp. RTGN4]|uniref:putative bifunctional diguanylate cyclase/phosphodiesterase n=1 Tax=unclassified Mycobacterium TaxID=2642494 RepID=UPI0039AF6CFD
MAVDAGSAADVSQQVLAELVDHFDVDVSFLRHNDHQVRATRLVAEWPPRQDIPDPDPLGVIYFKDADPIFAMLEHAKAPVVVRPEPVTDEYGRRIEVSGGIPVTSIAAAPLISGAVTTGALGFIKFDDREWNPHELNAVQAIASLFAQLQARIAAEEGLRHLADHDDMTDLPNRRALLAYLDDKLAPGRTGPVAALVVDLDRLKVINDHLGHTAGDRLIEAVADRLSSATGESGIVARFGGDEFAVVPSTPMDAEAAEVLAQRLHDGLQGRLVIEGELFRVTVSIGIAIAEPGHHSFDLLGRADEAMLAAKTAGGNQTVVFREQMLERRTLRSDVELHLQDVIEADGLVLHYLPEVDLRSGEVLGVEALVRWPHPTRGLLSPGSFIGLAESVNLAGALGRWVLQTACRHFADWRSNGLAEHVLLRINVSPVQLVSADFASTVGPILDEFGIPGSSVCFEFRESVVVQDFEAASSTLADLHALGINLAIDDFGTGYSVLQHLKSLPVDTIKIDGQFVSELGINPDDGAIVQSIMGLAEAFGLEVVAEGVETAAAARLLLQYGCRRAQGYLFSPPVSSDATKELLVKGVVSLADDDLRP